MSCIIYGEVTDKKHWNFTGALPKVSRSKKNTFGPVFICSQCHPDGRNQVKGAGKNYALIYQYYKLFRREIIQSYLYHIG